MTNEGVTNICDERQIQFRELSGRVKGQEILYEKQFEKIDKQIERQKRSIKRLRVAIICVAVAVILIGIGTIVKAAEYVPLGVPQVDSSFKTYMDYRTVTDTASPQYKYIHRWGWSDYDGFMRCDGEADLGITDNYYMVALGSYYGTEIGTKYRITLDTGRVFYAVLADQKDDGDTDSTHRYASNRDVVEFIVDTRRLHPTVKVMGTANCYMPLNGKVKQVERIEF